MNRKFIYISLGFILTATTVLIIAIRYFNQQTLMQNKILYLLPTNPKIILNFKNPNELYNKYLTQNMLFKNITLPRKQEFINTIQKIDSICNYIINQDIHIQDYSFYIVEYTDNAQVLCFSVQQSKDIQKTKKLLQKLNISYHEIDGNFFIPDHPQNIIPKNILNPSDSKNLITEWFNIFSKNPSIMHIYQNTDTSELAYQVDLDAEKISINGFIHYKKINTYSNYPKTTLLQKNYDYLTIKPFELKRENNENKDNDEYMKEFFSIIQQNYLKKQVSVSDIHIFPFISTDEISDIIKKISDSAFTTNSMLDIYKINKKYTPHFYSLIPLPYYLDTNLFISITPHNLCITPYPKAIEENQNLLSQNFSNTALYLTSLQNQTAQSIHTNINYNYFPIPFKLDSNNTFYDFYTEIFSSVSQKYFSFVAEITQKPVNYQYLWVYQHHNRINNILGLFDDHKTQLYFILLQDSLNNLIALNTNGDTLWTYSLDSPVKSDIFNVDILKNDKHQILFNTQNNIYLIDRNARNVGNFPLHFDDQISSPINVFDYENKKNYRIWFSTNKYLTYNYTLDGKIAEQFRPYFIQEPIINPLQYIKVGASDYIILISTKGTITGISRKGEGRFRLNSKIPSNTLHYYFDISNTLNTSYIYYCTPNTFARISLSDQHKEILQLNEEITDAKFIQNPLTKNTYLCTLFPSEIKIYSLKGEQINSIKTDTIYTQLNIQYSNANIYYILSNDHQHSIIIQNIDKNIVTYPRIHSTTIPRVINLFKNNQDYLIYVHNNKVFCKKI